MSTAVVNDRLKKRFQKWDVNGNGVIDRSDYEEEAHRIIKAFGEPPSAPKARALLDAYIGMYDQMAQQVGAQQHVTESQFIQYAETQMVQQGDAGFDRVLRPTISAIVELCDTDGDGQVSPAEFKRWLGAVGVPTSEADAAFRKLDTSGDGHLSVDELIQAVKDFHAGNSDVSLLGH